MIKVTRTVTENIDERDLFNQIKDMLFEEEINDNGDMVDSLPIDTQRLIFAKVGAMMIDYAGSEDFER